MLFDTQQNRSLQRYGVFVSKPSFTLQKAACCRSGVASPKVWMGPTIFEGEECFIVEEQQYFLWNVASQSTKWLDVLKTWGRPWPLGLRLCCRVPFVEQVVMKTQEKQRGEQLNGIREVLRTICQIFARLRPQQQVAVFASSPSINVMQ